MEKYSFFEKNQFVDLEIETSDEKRLYIAKSFLFNISDYFKPLLTNGCNETNSLVIKLSHPSKILNIIFKCYLPVISKNNEFIIKNCLEKLDNITDVCQFFHIVNEYLLTDLKNFADEFYASDEQIFSLYSTELIEMVHLLKLEKIKTGINKNLASKKLSVTALDYKKMNCSTIGFFTTWPDVVGSFCSWLKENDPSDKELRDAGMFDYKYKSIQRDLVETLVKAVRGIKDAPDFKFHVYENVMFALYPDTVKK